MKSNPAINKLEEYQHLENDSNSVMTLNGTIMSTFILGLILLLPATISWSWFAQGYMDKLYMGTTIGAIAALVFGLIVTFVPKTAPYLAPLYAFCEGILLGGLSAIFEKQFPGIVIQAVGATFVTLFSMLALYKSKLIEVTAKFRSVVTTLLFSICILYLVSFIIGLLENHAIAQYLWTPSPVSIGISCIVIIVAAFTLLLDFDSIERCSYYQMPGYMNWYCGFSLLMTLVWLYVEFLKLLALLSRSRN